MNGLMMDYPLTLQHTFNRAIHLFPEREVATLSALVNEFSQFVRFPSAKLESADVNSIVRDAIEVFSGRLDGITLNTACPGLHATERIKQLGVGAGARLGDPTDFGKVVAFLCSEPAGFISGTAVLVDGGGFPGLF